jgi:excisionase family DNA binding protein
MERRMKDRQSPSTDVPSIGPFYTTSEVARMLHMSQRVVQKWVRTGWLRAAHYGAAWRISHADLEAFVAQASIPPEDNRPNENGRTDDGK